MAQGVRVGVLMGGLSDEHDVSLMSGKRVLSAVPNGAAFPVLIEKSGAWQVDGTRHTRVGRAIDALKDRCDVAFLALHGPFGEDGTIQGMLEVAAIPYTGSSVLASALAMDKTRAKHLFTAHGLPTPMYAGLEQRHWDAWDETTRAQQSDAIAASVGFPCVLKPAEQGSSVGIEFPTDSETMLAAIQRGFTKARSIVIERFVKGREMTCGVIEDSEKGSQLALPVTEIVPGKDHAFFDYVAKYTPGATEEITPARITDSERSRIQELALSAHRILGCRDFSRTDFILDSEGNPTILETNTIPGLTPTSLLPQGAAEAGIPYDELIRILVRNAELRAIAKRA